MYSQSHENPAKFSLLKMMEKEKRTYILNAVQEKIERKVICRIFGITKPQLEWLTRRNRMFPLEIEKDTGRETVWKGRLPTTAKRIRREHPSWTVKRVRQACIEENGDVPSLSTFQRFLGDSGFTWKQLTAKPLLSAKNIQKRIEFAGLHQDWTVED
jgi:hypothetical protein